MKQDFPLYDTVVCGGGFAGLGAAFELSGKGLKVLVLEPAPSLGGEVTRACHLDVPAGVAFRLADRDRLVPELIRSGEEAARRLPVRRRARSVLTLGRETGTSSGSGTP
jgi:monoamine oxidase